jgi:hypothetical protein
MNAKQNIILVIGFILMLLNLWWGSQGSAIMSVIRGSTTSSSSSASNSASNSPETGTQNAQEASPTGSQNAEEAGNESALAVLGIAPSNPAINPNNNLPGFPRA